MEAGRFYCLSVSLLPSSSGPIVSALYRPDRQETQNGRPVRRRTPRRRVPPWRAWRRAASSRAQSVPVCVRCGGLLCCRAFHAGADPEQTRPGAGHRTQDPIFNLTPSSQLHLSSVPRCYTPLASSPRVEGVDLRYLRIIPACLPAPRPARHIGIQVARQRGDARPWCHGAWTLSPLHLVSRLGTLEPFVSLG